MRAIDGDALKKIFENRLGLLMERYGVDSSEAGVLGGAIKLIDAQPTIRPERKNVWHKTIFEGFPSESDQVLVTDGRYFWVDESVANDVGLEWSCFDGCWEDTEWAYFEDLYGLPSAQPDETLIELNCSMNYEGGYHEGYEQGYKDGQSSRPEIIHCRECEYWDTTWINEDAPDYHYCPMTDGTHKSDFYCGNAERRGKKDE